MVLWLCCEGVERVTCSRHKAQSRAALFLASSRRHGQRGHVDTTPYWTRDVTQRTADVKNSYAADQAKRYFQCHITLRCYVVDSLCEASVQSLVM